MLLVLVNVEAIAELVTAAVMLPKLSVVGLSVAVGPAPEPLRLTFCGLSFALSVMVTLPVRDPLSCGLKVTVMGQEALAGTWDTGLLVCVYSDGFGRVNAMGCLRVRLSVSFPVLVRMMGCGVPDEPTSMVPK